MKSKKFIRSSPHLPVKNLQQTLSYYRDILGFYDEWTWKNKEGEIKDGGLRRDDMRLLFAEDAEFTESINNSKHSLPLMWFVNNIDEVYAEFKNRDVRMADELRSHPYGLREFCFLDINGYYIRIAEKSE